MSTPPPFSFSSFRGGGLAVLAEQSLGPKNACTEHFSRALSSAILRPGTGLVEVERHAAAVSYRDVLVALGLRCGAEGLGTDFAGRVVASGRAAENTARDHADLEWGSDLALVCFYFKLPPLQQRPSPSPAAPAPGA